MTTATKSAPRDLNGAAEQITQLNDRLLDAGKQFGNLYLDGYEKVVASMTDAQKKLAEQSPVGVVKSLIEAQADLTSELSKTYTTAARAALA